MCPNSKEVTDADGYPIDHIRCDDCPTIKLDELIRSGWQSNKVSRVLDLDFATENFNVDYLTTPADEFYLLRSLRLMRNEYHKKKREEKSTGG